MASAGTAGTAGGSLPPNFMLTPQQQSLLFAALNSNKPQLSRNSDKPNQNFSPSVAMKNPPAQNKSTTVFQDSPFLDGYDYDFGDSSFDFSFAGGDQNMAMIGDIPETAASDSTGDDGLGEVAEKRSHPDDDEDEDDDTKGPKRRESADKVPKKPGRKPLTSEPSSKRKAQNRAAQRAFRERKEKHLKDLETKVEELGKASEAAHHENSQLRAQVERMTVELKQYKQRIAVMSNDKPASRDKVGFGSAPPVNNLTDVNFEFNFPKFGTLPGPPAKSQQQLRSTSQPISPPSQHQSQVSSPAKTHSVETNSQDGHYNKDEVSNLAKFSGVFTPSMSSSITNGSRASLDSANYSVGAATSSPASSHSNGGPSSSCGTSPEPFTQSPMGSKPIETMKTIGEEQSALTATEPFAQFANLDFSATNFDWLAQQNGGQFDPQLFGDYREPQDKVLSNPSFDDFFNDAIDNDFITPYNMPTSPAVKKNLIDEIDAQKDDYDDATGQPKDMNCNQIWEKLHSCPKAQTGEFDLDGLCSELTQKAKCSGTGPVVGEHDFDNILKKYMGKELDTNSLANDLGIEVDRTAKPNGVGMP